MSGTDPVEKITGQLEASHIVNQSDVNASEYVGIMEGLKDDIEKILKLQKLQVDKKFIVDIKFVRKPNKPERDDGDHSPKRIRIKRIGNPLEYAWEEHKKYKSGFSKPMEILFVGMNPSTKAPSGIPFQNKNVMEHWNIQVQNDNESGDRFWSLIKEYVHDIKNFHEKCFVINCSPLVFVGDVKPVNHQSKEDKSEVGNESISLDNFYESDLDQGHFLLSLLKESDDALTDAINFMQPKLIIAIGWYAWDKVKKLDIDTTVVGKCYIQHPSGKNFNTKESWLEEGKWKLHVLGADEILKKM